MWRSANKGALRLSLVALFCLTACASVAPVIKIGLVAPFEGRQREIGYDAIYSARLAVREINEAGGIGGYRVTLVALDDGGDVMLAGKTAESLTLDPAVVVVMGHWLTATTAVAAPIYAQANVPFVALSQPPFTPFVPDNLPASFRTAYEAVTPFDEVAGDYAGPTYDAMQLLRLALAHAATNGRINRQGVAAALDGLEYEGLTGQVYKPGE
jgi:ABC-type branched-subunit amino acid transport system substrate-binding protein